MSHWNYRILARKDHNEIRYEFYEVYYNDNDVPDGFTANAVNPLSFGDIEDPIDSLKWQLDAMKLACDKPVLDYDNFPREFVRHLRKKKLKAIENIFE